MQSSSSSPPHPPLTETEDDTKHNEHLVLMPTIQLKLSNKNICFFCFFFLPLFYHEALITFRYSMCRTHHSSLCLFAGRSPSLDSCSTGWHLLSPSKVLLCAPSVPYSFAFVSTYPRLSPSPTSVRHLLINLLEMVEKLIIPVASLVDLRVCY